jgi:hypothetical protein
MTLHTRTDAPAHEAATNAPTPHAQPANARHRACPPLLRCWTRPRRAALDRGGAGAHEPPRSERVELGDKRAWRRQRREHEAAARTRGGGAAFRVMPTRRRRCRRRHRRRRPSRRRYLRRCRGRYRRCHRQRPRARFPGRVSRYRACLRFVPVLSRAFPCARRGDSAADAGADGGALRPGTVLSTSAPTALATALPTSAPRRRQRNCRRRRWRRRRRRRWRHRRRRRCRHADRRHCRRLRQRRCRRRRRRRCRRRRRRRCRRRRRRPTAMPTSVGTDGAADVGSAGNSVGVGSRRRTWASDAGAWKKVPQLIGGSVPR